MNKISLLFFIVIFTAQAMEKKAIKIFSGCLALNTKQWPELAGYPETSIFSEYSAKRKIENSLKVTLSADEILFPIFAWPLKYKTQHPPLDNEVIKEYPEHLPFDLIKDLQEGKKLTLSLPGNNIFILRAQQTKDQNDPQKTTFHDTLRKELEKVLNGYLEYGTGQEQELLIKNAILEKTTIKNKSGFEYNPLTAQSRKQYEDFLQNK